MPLEAFDEITSGLATLSATIAGQGSRDAVDAGARRILEEMRRGRTFRDRTGDLRRSFQLGTPYMTRTGRAVASVLAGGIGFGAQPVAVEYGVTEHGTYGTQDFGPPIGRRGSLSYMGRAMAKVRPTLVAVYRSPFQRNFQHAPGERLTGDQRRAVIYSPAGREFVARAGGLSNVTGNDLVRLYNEYRRKFYG